MQPSDADSRTYNCTLAAVPCSGRGSCGIDGVCLCDNVLRGGSDCSLMVYDRIGLKAFQAYQFGFGLVFFFLAICAAYLFARALKKHPKLSNQLSLKLVLLACLTSGVTRVVWLVIDPHRAFAIFSAVGESILAGISTSLSACQMFGIIDMWLGAVANAESRWRWPVRIRYLTRFFCFAFVVSQTLGDLLRPITRQNGNLAAFRALSVQNYIVVAITGLVTAIGFLIAGTVIKRRLKLFDSKNENRQRTKLLANISNGLVAITIAAIVVIIVAIIGAVALVATSGQPAPQAHLIYFALQCVARCVEFAPLGVVIFFFRSLRSDKESDSSTISSHSMSRNS
eukprot:TRINITY_DN15108_c0_g1_i1.p1 TRINITY_DN15108_c0_g1~~TRINITY_DN15108_c0_g1_i1.p1  ORF type:complete len:340 (+),score=28.48 TRINITY_DN15108_c0_g1_i1:25-1044(+)